MVSRKTKNGHVTTIATTISNQKTEKQFFKQTRYVMML
jgi:hypothetical protein